MSYRINGFEQIKGFYSWAFENQELGIKPQHISLYLFLVNQNNRNNWVEWFKLPYDLAMAGSCISSKKTYYNCLNDLQKWSLIKYTQGVNNWKAPLIKLEVLKDTSTVPQSEPQVLQADVPQHIQALIQAATPQPIQNIKLLTYNLKLVTDNLKHILEFLEIPINEVNSEEKEKNIREASLKILTDFNFTETKNFNKLRQISDFVRVLISQDRFDYFIEQYPAYWEYKNKSEEKKQSLDTFLENGWDREVWTEKLKELKNAKSKQSTSEAKQQSVSELREAARKIIADHQSENG